MDVVGANLWRTTESDPPSGRRIENRGSQGNKPLAHDPQVVHSLILGIKKPRTESRSPTGFCVELRGVEPLASRVRF